VKRADCVRPFRHRKSMRVSVSFFCITRQFKEKVLRVACSTSCWNTMLSAVITGIAWALPVHGHSKGA
jgi:hypothetical protein